MPPLPSPVRAALGLVASLLDEARSLPDKAIELPMLAISRALQLSLRAQQRYAALAARGDELLSRRQTTDEPPPWATFDPPDEPAATFDPPDEPAAAEPAPADDGPAATEEIPAKAPKPRKPRTTKTVRAPRTGTPSAFDAVGDSPDDAE